MIRIRCAKCEKRLAILDSRAGSLGACPACGHQFRIPDLPAVAETEFEAVVEVDDDPHPEPLAGKRPVPVAEAFEDDEPEEVPDERKPRRKKKKKKRKADGASDRGRSNLVIGLVMGGLAVLLPLGYFSYKAFFGGPAPPPDPGPARAALAAKGATFIPASPDQPVIEIQMVGSQFNDRDLAHLKAFPKLRRLNLATSQISNLGLEYLEELTELEELSLAKTNISGGLRHLKKLVNLRKLDVGQTIVTDNSLNELKGLTKLERLGVTDSLASGRGLQAVMPNLIVDR